MKKLETLASIIESILFVSGDAVAVRDIAEKLCLPDKQIMEEAEKLQREKYNADSGIHLLIFNKKLQFGTNKNNADSVATVLNPIKERELSKSMLEVAAIIAYKQPVTRMDLEEIRNCSCEYALQNLLKLGVVEVVGRKDSIGHPALFGTTDNFLKRFQISSLDELPDYNGLIEKIKLLHGTDESSYLFQKDVYDESKDPELANNSVDDEIAASRASGGTLSEEDDPIKIPSRAEGNIVDGKPEQASDEDSSEDYDSDKDSDADEVDEDDTDIDNADDDEEESSVAGYDADDDGETV